MPVVGKVVELWRYPFKSMQGGRLDAVSVGDQGVWGDRGWSLRYADSRKNVSAKQIGALMQCSARYTVEPSETSNPAVEITMPDGKTVLTDGDNPRAILSEFADDSPKIGRVEDVSGGHGPPDQNVNAS